MENSENDLFVIMRERTWFELLLIVFHRFPAEKIREFYHYQFAVSIPPEYAFNLRKLDAAPLESTSPVQRFYLDHLIKENLADLQTFLNILRPFFEDEGMAVALLHASESFGMHARLQSNDLEMQKLVRDLFSLTHSYRLQKDKARG